MSKSGYRAEGGTETVAPEVAAASSSWAKAESRSGMRAIVTRRHTRLRWTPVLGVQPPIGRNCGRSMVLSQKGMAATSQVAASQAAAQILARGGSAADAAIAANAVL